MNLPHFWREMVARVSPPVLGGTLVAALTQGEIHPAHVVLAAGSIVAMFGAHVWEHQIQ